MYGIRVFLPLYCGAAIAVAASLTQSTEAATPAYHGTACPDGNGLRYEVHTDPDVILCLIFLGAPGAGGYAMTQNEPGLWSIDVSQANTGDQIAFSLLLQNPLQYVYPDHTFVLTDECYSFDWTDVTPPPARGFRESIKELNGTYLWEFEAGGESVNIPATNHVEVDYRLNNGPLLTAILGEDEAGLWTGFVPGASAGDQIEYYYKQMIGVQPMDTTRFTRTLGEAEAAIPDYPITTITTGRFRDRHPNEWRFDNYVDLYSVARTYEVKVVDYGNKIDVITTVDPEVGVGGVDFKYFVQSGPYDEMCDRPLTNINLNMDRNGHIFTKTVEDLTPGAIIEWDYTFLGLPTDSPVGQYYSEFFYYHVGQGRFGKYSNPRAYAAGAASIPEVVTPRFGFAQHAQRLKIEELNDFMAGKVRFETDHMTGDLINLPTYFDCCSGPIGFVMSQSPVFEAGQLGPKFNSTSCISCHMLDGKGATPNEGMDLQSLVVQLSIPGVDETGGPIAHPYYGHQLNTQSIDGVQAEGNLRVDYTEQSGTFADGETYSLRVPSYQFSQMAFGALGKNMPDVDGTPGYRGMAQASPRIAPMLAGLGLLESVSEEDILSRVDETDHDGDGISGRPNWVYDHLSDSMQLGRFGWKASQPNLLQQTAAAFHQDIGLTSSIFPKEDCGNNDAQCNEIEDSGVEISQSDLNLVEAYVRGLTLPPRRNFEDPDAIAGMHLFRQAKCHTCHAPSLQTSENYPIVGFRGQRIEAFTDMLLHDMGPALADNRPHFDASSSEWRTPPLWALGYVKHVLGVPETCTDPFSGGAHPNFLHDGRARSISEAILWHGGEGQSSRDSFIAMTGTERSQLLAYLEYPFADPIFDDKETHCPSDFDGSGVVDIGDFSILLLEYGTVGSSPADLNGDSIVNITDFTAFLVAFGTTCSQ